MNDKVIKVNCRICNYGLLDSCKPDVCNREKNKDCCQYIELKNKEVIKSFAKVDYNEQLEHLTELTLKFNNLLNSFLKMYTKGYIMDNRFTRKLLNQIQKEVKEND